MKILKGLSTLFIILLAWTAYGQDVTFKASAPEVVGRNENFKLSYTVNTDEAENLQVQRFSAFNYSGPSRSTQTSVRVVNGQMSRQVKTTYAYFMEPKKTGTFTIGPASIEVDGETYKSNEVTIKVIEEKQQASGSNQSSGQKQAQKRKVGNDEVFVRLHLSKASVYQGEHIGATIKVYTRLDIASLQDFETPAFDGFWSNEIKTSGNITFERENVNGTIYHSGVLAKYLLFPQRSGTLTVAPARVKLAVRKQVAKPSFFDSGYRNVTVNLKSRERNVQVKPLPQGAPASFDGAVGDLDIKATVSKEKVQANNAINYKVTVSGNGNIKLIEPFDANFPSDFDQFEPEISQNINNSLGGASGSKTFDYLLIPRYAGTFTIPSLDFSYFNPATGRYKTLSTKPFKIKVAKGEKSGAGTVVRSRGNKEEVQILDRDIRYIKQGETDLQEKDAFFFGSALFWGLHALGVLLLGGFWAWHFRRRKLRRNADLVRNRQASKISQKRLKTAHQYLKNQDDQKFYDEALRAFWGYISDKLGMKQADLNRENLARELQKRQVQEHVRQELNEVLDTCEYARYAPPGSTGSMQELYEKAGRVIRQLEDALKR